MRTEEKTAVKNSVGRMAFVLLSLLGQVGWIVFLVVKLNQYSAGISLFTSFLALIVALRILVLHRDIRKSQRSAAAGKSAFPVITGAAYSHHIARFRPRRFFDIQKSYLL